MESGIQDPGKALLVVCSLKNPQATLPLETPKALPMNPMNPGSRTPPWQNWQLLQCLAVKT